MRRLITALIVSLALTGAAGQLAAKKIATYGVAFYNLENLFDTINNKANTIWSSVPRDPTAGTARSTGRRSRTLDTPFRR